MLVFIQTKKWQKVFGRGSGKDHVDALLCIRAHYVNAAQDLKRISNFLDAVNRAWNPYVNRIEKLVNGSRETE